MHPPPFLCISVAAGGSGGGSADPARPHGGTCQTHPHLAGCVDCVQARLRVKHHLVDSIRCSGSNTWGRGMRACAR